MNIVSFYAPRPDHMFFQDYTPFLRILEESCRKFGHRHIVITDTDLPEFETFKVELSDNVMHAVLEGQLAYLQSPFAKTDTIFVDGDCVLANDPAEVFNQEFDIALTTHASLYSSMSIDQKDGTKKTIPFQDSIVNNGVIFIRGGADAAKFWDLAVKVAGDAWGADQIALAAAFNAQVKHKLYERQGVKVRFFPEYPYNVVPNSPGRDCSRSYVLHFRGQRKDYMVDYCAKHLGIGVSKGPTVLVNTEDNTIFENVRRNSRLPLPWVSGKDAHDGHAVLVGGGPSLMDTLEEVKWRAGIGQTIFALNNTATFLVGHGIMPDYQVSIDARPENVRFVKDLPAKRFLFASQCHPDMIDAVPAERLDLFHCASDAIGDYLPKDREAILIGGGISSGITAMALAFTLGYRKLHLYGYDSSDRKGAGHAYAQEETEAEKKRVKCWHNDVMYLCQPCMFKQAEAFAAFAQKFAENDCLITVHGDGLLPAIARSMSSATLYQPSKESEN